MFNHLRALLVTVAFTGLLVGCAAPAASPTASQPMTSERSTESTQTALFARAVQDLLVADPAANGDAIPHDGSFIGQITSVESGPNRLIVKRTVNGKSHTVQLNSEAVVVAYPSDSASDAISPGEFRPDVVAMTPGRFAELWAADGESLSKYEWRIVMIDGTASTVVAYYQP